MTNLIELTDSYKFSHFNQYPDNVKAIHSYMESRGGAYDSIVFFGLQYYLQKYFTVPITSEDVNHAAKLAKLHGVPFNREGWDRVVEVHGGLLPIIIRAVPEGTVVKPHNVIMTVENTDPELPWLTSFVETILLKVWYTTTIASKSLSVRKTIQKYWNDTCLASSAGIDFSFHNFGDRGSSSVESAALAGAAHLTVFKGTDNFNALNLVAQHYEDPCAGFSIPASEHSTVTSWGRDAEYDMITEYLEANKGQPIIACVMDSYDVFKAVDFATCVLKSKIESSEYPIFVLRPDSGEPVEVIRKILDIMVRNDVAYTINAQGYKLFNKYRIIWGDGITPAAIERMLDYVKFRGYSADNMAFGSGGDLCQNVTRDTCKFAFKASAAIDERGEEYPIFKDPITDPGKTSKKYRQTYIKWKILGWHDKKASKYQTIRVSDFDPSLHEEIMRDVYVNGKLLNIDPFYAIRERVNNHLQGNE